MVCYSKLISDPRVTRQIDWLLADGWVVDTLGIGPVPRPGVRDHFEMKPYAGVRALALFRLAAHALLPFGLRFRTLEGSQIPKSVTAGVRRNGYDLLLVNDIDLLPWVADTARELLRVDPPGLCHVDVHEYHRWEAPGGSSPVRRWLFARYHAWLVSFVGHPVFTSRSTVARGIAELYADDFAIPVPSLVRNSPAFVDLAPSPVDPDAIQLVYHGNADLARGLSLLIDAMETIEDRFTLNLMLTGTDSGKAALRELTAKLGSRARIRDAVPMNQVAAEINGYDLEVIFYPPTGPNYLHSFPNKFFEAVQGRLGIVIGESPSMAEVVRQFHNGVVVDGWAATDLARTINSLSVHQIEAMKAGSAVCAHELNSDQEGKAFLAPFARSQ